MDALDTRSGIGQPVDATVRDQLLMPFVEATRAALGEMAGTEVTVRAVYRATPDHSLTDISAVVRLAAATEGLLVLSFPGSTAAALARQVLAETICAVGEDLVRDCMAEIANVVAGQAKALFAETPYRFAFFVPEVLVGGRRESWPKQGSKCLVIDFASVLGGFMMQLVLHS